MKITSSSVPLPPSRRRFPHPQPSPPTLALLQKLRHCYDFRFIKIISFSCHAVDSAHHDIDDYLCFSCIRVVAARRRHSSCCLRADLHTSRSAVLTPPGGTRSWLTPLSRGGSCHRRGKMARGKGRDGEEGREGGVEKLALITSCIFKRAHAAGGEESSILRESQERDRCGEVCSCRRDGDARWAASIVCR